MKYCFYCNGTNDSFSQCYADSPSVAGFYIGKPHQTIMQSRVYFSKWANDATGVGFLIAPGGKDGAYVGNVLFANEQHRLAKAFDGALEDSCILGTSGWNVVGGFENRIPSGGSSDHPPLKLAGTGFRLPKQAAPPALDEGEAGELRWVDDGKSSALWVKTTRGWKKSELL